MRKQYNVFVCEECKKESKLMEEQHKFHTGYPYGDKWVYLYCLNFKLDKDKESNFNDKHFCSKECMNKFICKALKIGNYLTYEDWIK